MEDKKPQPKKKFGQNFLISPNIAERIVLLVNAKDDRKVVEIGPGFGALSVFLKNKYPRFHCIEKDKELVPFLKEKIGVGEWSVHECDVLDFDFQTLGSPLHIIGNLPFNVAALIIKKTLYLSPLIASVTFMVQREVAERIVAKPHSKQNGYLTIFCQFFGTPKIAFHIPPGAFYPKPKIDSSVFQIQIDKNIENRLPSCEWKSFFEFVSMGFSKRRKMLINALSWHNDLKPTLVKCMNQAELDPTARPEDLNIENWLKLYLSIKEYSL